MNAEEAVRLARLAAAAGLPKWIKLESIPTRVFCCRSIETFKAAEILVKEGFTVLPYINADPVLAKRLQDVGVATVMPLGSPIGRIAASRRATNPHHHRASHRAGCRGCLVSARRATRRKRWRWRGPRARQYRVAVRAIPTYGVASKMAVEAGHTRLL